MNQRSLLLTCAVSTCLMTASHAATFFSASLTTNTNFTTHGPSVSFGGAGALFNGSGDSQRTYLSTNDLSYGGVAFVATVEFTYDPANQGAFYFGIGTGDVGGFYNSPDVGQAGHSGAWIAWDPRNSDPASGKFESMGITNGSAVNLFADTENPFTTTVPFENGVSSLTTMTWNPATRQITWALDINKDGSFEETHSAILDQAIVDRWQLASPDPSAIYFGGNGSLTATNFSVVPEPSTAVLLGLGSLALLKRRRR